MTDPLDDPGQRALAALDELMRQIDEATEQISRIAERADDVTPFGRADVGSPPALGAGPDRRGPVDPDVLLGALDGRIEQLGEQVGRLHVSATKVEELLEASLRRGGVRDLTTAVKAVDRRVRALTAIVSVGFVVLVVLSLL